MKWNKVLDDWSSNKPFTYPKNLNKKISVEYECFKKWWRKCFSREI